MTALIEITSTGTLDPTIVEADMAALVYDLNIAAASGKQFIIMQEHGAGAVALETRNITRMREIEGDADAFIGS